jgi:hypothetical protein
VATLKQHFLAALSIEQFYFESLTIQCHQFEFDESHENYKQAFMATQGLAINGWTKRDYYIDDSDVDDVDEISAWDAFTFENALTDWTQFYESFVSIPISGNGPDSCDRAPGVLSCGDLSVELEEFVQVDDLSKDDIKFTLADLSKIVATNDFEQMAKDAITQTYRRLLDSVK